MAHGIEGLAYDWERKNLYWSDAGRKWIMVTDRMFKHYASVYQSEDEVFGITIHVKYR